MTNQEQFACKLTPQDQERRAREDKELGAQLLGLHRPESDHVTLTFPAAAKPLVQTFIREESACCPFFGFNVETDDQIVQLHVTAPAGGEHMLNALVDTFDQYREQENSEGHR